MFPRSAPPFLEFASDLYTSNALQPPPAAVAAPPPRADWTSYRGPATVQSPEYQTFRNSPDFLTVHQQWRDRIADCERFATQRCSPEEARQILAGLQRMRDILNDRHGEPYVGNNMALLFGDAKRAMDHFCQRLVQEELPQDFRSARLRELASTLPTCQATGPAFLRAARDMDIPPEGLHGAFWDIFTQRADDALRRVFQREHPDAHWGQIMEVHGVNRMRLEYGLPGGDPTDVHSLGADLFKTLHRRQHESALRQALNPVQVAEDLADRYWQALGTQLPAQVAPRTARADVGEHMPAIQNAVTALDVALTPVSLNSLLALDEATEEVHWQSGSALLSLELLQALERDKLVVEQPRNTLWSTTDDRSRRELKQVGTGLFHISETLDGQATPSRRPVRVGDLLLLEPKEHGLPPADWASLVTTALQEDASEHLRQVPPRWLTSPMPCRSWLRRLGPDDGRQWLKDHPSLPVHTWMPLAAAMNDLDRGAELDALLGGREATNPTWIGQHGRSLIPLSFSATTESTQAVWRRYWRHHLPLLNAGSVSALLAPPKSPPLLASALGSGVAFQVSLAAELIVLAVERQRIPRSKAALLLKCPLQSAMQAGHLAALTPLGELLRKAAREGWIDTPALTRFLSENGVGRGCEGAMTAEDDASLKWYLDLIGHLLAEDLLDQRSAASLVAARRKDGTVVTHEAVRLHHAQHLKTYFNWLMDAVQAGRFPQNCLLQQLTCSGHDECGLDAMVDARDESCLTAWCDVLVRAVRDGLVKTSQVERLLTALDRDGQPAMHRVIDVLSMPPIDSVNPLATRSSWFTAVGRLFRDGALDASQFISLLRGGVHRTFGIGSPLLYRLMVRNQDTERTYVYLNNLVGLRFDGLLTDEAFECLAAAPSPGSHSPALIDVVKKQAYEVLDHWTDVMMYLGKHQQFPSAALVRLLDGRTAADGDRVHRSALVTAIHHKDVTALTQLMTASLAMHRDGVITVQDWQKLLYPDHESQDPVRALQRSPHRQCLQAFRSLLDAAQRQQLLTQTQLTDLNSRLPRLRSHSHTR